MEAAASVGVSILAHIRNLIEKLSLYERPDGCEVVLSLRHMRGKLDRPLGYLDACCMYFYFMYVNTVLSNLIETSIAVVSIIISAQRIYVYFPIVPILGKLAIIILYLQIIDIMCMYLRML